MRRKYCNWIAGKALLQEVFENSMRHGMEVRILTTLDHVSKSGMTRHISAFVPVVRTDTDGNTRADLVCIAREVLISGCGMDMGFQLAYNLFHEVYSYKDMPYQKYLSHRWL